MYKKVQILDAQKLQKRFKKITEDDKSMAEQLGFYEFLLSFANVQTNARHLVLILTLALEKVTGSYPVNLSNHVDALVDDPDTIKEARDILVNVAARSAK